MIALAERGPVFTHDPCPDLFRVSRENAVQAVTLRLVGRRHPHSQDIVETCSVDRIGGKQALVRAIHADVTSLNIERNIRPLDNPGISAWSEPARECQIVRGVWT